MATTNQDPARKPPPGGPPAAAPGDRNDGPPPAAAVLTGIGMQYELWHDAGKRAYATAGRHTYPVRSTAFGELLTHEYYRQTGKAAIKEAVAAAVGTLTAAKYDGARREAAVRLAEHAGWVYLHLADADGTVVEVDAGGWRVCPDPPVRFVVPAGMLPLPVPGGTLDELRAFVNLPDDDAFALLVGWLMAGLYPTGPHPLLVDRASRAAPRAPPPTWSSGSSTRPSRSLGGCPGPCKTWCCTPPATGCWRSTT